jgi:hypothetical protein
MPVVSLFNVTAGGWLYEVLKKINSAVSSQPIELDVVSGFATAAG